MGYLPESAVKRLRWYISLKIPHKIKNVIIHSVVVKYIFDYNTQ